MNESGKNTGREGNLLASLPDALREEVSEELLRGAHVRIERIISRGQSSPMDHWYDQAENEWVLVLEGAGKIMYEDGTVVSLTRGDYLHIPAHVRHRVSWTDPARSTIWLAVFHS